MMKIDSGQGSKKIAGVLLAAGLSTRAGSKNKLLSLVGDRPMVTRVAEIALAGKLDPIIVVTGHDAKAVSAILTGLDIRICFNPDYRDGMAASIRIGIASLSNNIDGALIMLGDMPWLRDSTIMSLKNAFMPLTGAKILCPVCHGRLGNPALFSKHFFGALMNLSGDRGAKQLILREHASRIEVSVDDVGIFRDIDTLSK
tara:strand:- start:83 stop:682 length:600 start_codon:yes stop_codon:yes gene_type:complete